MIPARSRYSSRGIATRRVVPRACRAWAAVNGWGSPARARAASAAAPGASTICSVTRRVAIPLLEYLDRSGITQRLPDDRRRLR